MLQNYLNHYNYIIVISVATYVNNNIWMESRKNFSMGTIKVYLIVYLILSYKSSIRKTEILRLWHYFHVPCCVFFLLVIHTFWRIVANKCDPCVLDRYSASQHGSCVCVCVHMSVGVSAWDHVNVGVLLPSSMFHQHHTSLRSFCHLAALSAKLNPSVWMMQHVSSCTPSHLV